jgi:medium-chain acyl-[acyl-carrier-protein] hydrolase
MSRRAANAWFIWPKQRPISPSLRLFCFPYAGGGASIFRTWPAMLPAEIEVCAVELPGHESRWVDPPITDVTELVRNLGDILPEQMDVPVAFFGHSMGALIAFALARDLRRRHQISLKHMFVSGFRAPQLIDPAPLMHKMPESGFLQELQERYGTPDEIQHDPELAELYLPLMRADFALCESFSYSQEDPFDFPISGFGGIEDRKINREQLLAWREQTRSAFHMRVFPGGHFYLNGSSQPLLLRVLGQQLSQAGRRGLRVAASQATVYSTKDH